MIDSNVYVVEGGIELPDHKVVLSQETEQPKHDGRVLFFCIFSTVEGAMLLQGCMEAEELLLDTSYFLRVVV